MQDARPQVSQETERTLAAAPKTVVRYGVVHALVSRGVSSTRRNLAPLMTHTAWATSLPSATLWTERFAEWPVDALRQQDARA